MTSIISILFKTAVWITVILQHRISTTAAAAEEETCTFSGDKLCLTIPSLSSCDSAAVVSGDTATCSDAHPCKEATLRGCTTIICSGPLSCYQAKLLDVPDTGTVHCSGTSACFDAEIKAADGASISVECSGPDGCYSANIDTGGAGGTVDCSGKTSCIGDLLFDNPTQITSACLDCTSGGCIRACSYTMPGTASTTATEAMECINNGQNGDCSAGTTSTLGCFSATSTVTVLGKGIIQMRHLQIGDEVLTGNSNQYRAKYSRVYAFGHHSINARTKFYQISTTAAGVLPIEMTGDHLVFVQGKVNPVRADAVQVDDVLVGENGSGLFVKSVTTVEKSGLYAPMTLSGSLLVNGIVSSNYIALQDTHEEFAQLFWGGKGKGQQINFLSHHTLAHLYTTPFRLLCTGISNKLCLARNSDGISVFLDLGVKIALTAERQNVLVSIIFFVVTIPFMTVLSVVENKFGVHLAAFVVLLCFAIAASAIFALKATNDCNKK